jgi:lambda repressor-like predicted transcriptional regulator
MARLLVSEDEWERRRGVVARFAESGLSMAEFARREGIAYAALLACNRPTITMAEGLAGRAFGSVRDRCGLGLSLERLGRSRCGGNRPTITMAEGLAGRAFGVVRDKCGLGVSVRRIRPTNPMSTGRFLLWHPPIRAV